MRNIIIIIAIILFCACIAVAYIQGLGVGQNKGYRTGYDKGYASGIIEGNKSGYFEGYAIGHQVGQESGFIAGKMFRQNEIDVILEKKKGLIVHRYWLRDTNRVVYDRISTTEYINYKLKKDRPLENDYTEYVTYDDPHIKDLAETIRQSDAEYLGSSLDYANAVLDIVQQMRYEYDVDVYYTKYPIETLAEGSGDCEDKSILYASIMKATGYEVCLLDYPGHVMVGLHVNETPLNLCYLEIEGKKYWACETTGDYWQDTDWEVGQCPEEFIGKNVSIIRI